MKHLLQFLATLGGVLVAMHFGVPIPVIFVVGFVVTILLFS